MATPRYLALHKAWGRNVRRLRGDRTQAQIARRAGIDQSTLSRVETGDYRALTPDLIIRLADALDAEPGDLCPWPSRSDRQRSGVGRVA